MTKTLLVEGLNGHTISCVAYDYITGGGKMKNSLPSLSASENFVVEDDLCAAEIALACDIASFAAAALRANALLKIIGLATADDSNDFPLRLRCLEQ